MLRPVNKRNLPFLLVLLARKPHKTRHRKTAAKCNKNALVSIEKTHTESATDSDGNETGKQTRIERKKKKLDTIRIYFGAIVYSSGAGGGGVGETQNIRGGDDFEIPDSTPQ